MDFESFQSNWAIWLALAALLIAVVMIIPIFLKRTSRSKLNRVLDDMKEARKELRQSMRAAKKAEKRVRQMMGRANHVKPRLLQEAKDAVEDGKALAKILGDKVMIAENHVRRVIHDEFPPAKHDRMREKYLPQDGNEKRPFSF